MCTLIILNEHVNGYPLIVVGNRDERYDRPSRPPACRYLPAIGRSVVNPWDGEKGGTWMGIAQDGWFVSLTNQDDGKHNDNLMSRGLLINGILEAGGHRAAARILARLDAIRYNPFNLVFGRPGAMFLTRVNPACCIEMDPIPDGITVISNDCCGTRYQRKLNHAHAMSSNIQQDDDINDVTLKLFHTLSNHDNATGDPFQALCVHADTYAFGTRSTSLVTVSNQGVVEYWYSEGPPCQSGGLTLVGRMLHLEPEIPA